MCDEKLKSKLALNVFVCVFFDDRRSIERARKKNVQRGKISTRSSATFIIRSLSFFCVVFRVVDFLCEFLGRHSKLWVQRN